MENVLHLRKKGKKKEKPIEEFVSNFRLNFTYMTGKVEEFLVSDTTKQLC
jgi:hypothetical protein